MTAMSAIAMVLFLLCGVLAGIASEQSFDPDCAGSIDRVWAASAIIGATAVALALLEAAR